MLSECCASGAVIIFVRMCLLHFKMKSVQICTLFVGFYVEMWILQLRNVSDDFKTEGTQLIYNFFSVFTEICKKVINFPTVCKVEFS
jgi:hypothetical protein